MLMKMQDKEDVKDILEKYGSKIEGQINLYDEDVSYSREYVKFKKEMAPDLTRYERWCGTLGSFVKLKISENDDAKIRKHLKVAHLDIEPWQALTLAVMSFLSVFFIGAVISVAIALIKGGSNISAIVSNFPFLFFFLMIIFSLFLFY